MPGLCAVLAAHNQDRDAYWYTEGHEDVMLSNNARVPSTTPATGEMIVRKGVSRAQALVQDET